MRVCGTRVRCLKHGCLGVHWTPPPRFVSAPVACATSVTVTVDSRKVTVTGKRGTLTREFKHVNVAFVVLGKKSIRVDMWFGNRLQLACLRTTRATSSSLQTRARG